MTGGEGTEGRRHRLIRVAVGIFFGAVRVVV